LNFKIFAPFKRWLMSFNSINPAHVFLKNYCRGEVIDIGANIGNYSKYFIKHGAKVYAFEPTINTFNILKSNIKNAECFNVLLGNSIGKTKFYYSGTSGENSAIPQDELTQETEVFQTKLDEYKFKRITLIKIDTQGMDYEVLLGAVNTIKEHKPAILLECWEKGLNARGYSVKNIYDFMSVLGYTGKKVYDCGDYHDMFYQWAHNK
jgi:FkbM family methyltransferase